MLREKLTDNNLCISRSLSTCHFSPLQFQDIDGCRFLNQGWLSLQVSLHSNCAQSKSQDPHFLTSAISALISSSVISEIPSPLRSLARFMAETPLVHVDIFKFHTEEFSLCFYESGHTHSKVREDQCLDDCIFELPQLFRFIYPNCTNVFAIMSTPFVLIITSDAITCKQMIALVNRLHQSTFRLLKVFYSISLQSSDTLVVANKRFLNCLSACR